MKLNFKTKNVLKIIIILFLSNCNINENPISNINSENEFIGEWKLYSTEMPEVINFFDYLLEEDVNDTVTIKLFTDELNNWTWVLNEDSLFNSIELLEGKLSSNASKWSLSKDYFISINGHRVFGQNEFLMINNNLNILIEKEFEGIQTKIEMIFKKGNI